MEPKQPLLSTFVRLSGLSLSSFSPWAQKVIHHPHHLHQKPIVVKEARGKSKDFPTRPPLVVIFDEGRVTPPSRPPWPAPSKVIGLSPGRPGCAIGGPDLPESAVPSSLRRRPTHPALAPILSRHGGRVIHPSLPPGGRHAGSPGSSPGRPRSARQGPELPKSTIRVVTFDGARLPPPSRPHGRSSCSVTGVGPWSA